MTALENFLEQIILKKVEGSVYLLPAITDVQIVQALKEEREQGEQYPLLSVSYSEAELKAKLDEQKNEIREWLIGMDFEGLAESL